MPYNNNNNWQLEDELKKELGQVIKRPGNISKDQVQTLTGLTSRLVADCKEVVANVVRFLENAPSSHKLNFLYVIDAICKSDCKSTYIPEFTQCLDRIGSAACDCQSSSLVYTTHHYRFFIIY